MAETTVYGKAHVSIASIDDDAGSAIAVSSHASRFGVKGTVDSDSDTKVVYKMEWQIDMTDASKSSADHIKARSQYVGLQAGWGELHIGRDDSPYKTAGSKFTEFFGDTYADANNVIDKGQDLRADNAVKYTVKAGPGKLGVMYAAGSDSTASENAGDVTAIAYDANLGSFDLAIATQTINKSATNDETATKLAAGFKLGEDTQIGLIFETVKDDLSLDDKNTLISVNHKMGDDAVKFVYGMKDQGLANDATMTAIGYDHKMNKSTTVYALYANGTDNGLDEASGLAGDGSAIAFGMVVKF
jgi:predicted porin